jgi:hypothetical protein
LFLKFQKLSEEFLGIAVDSGQILDVADFVKEYQKNRFATRLDTTFRCRARELVRIVRVLRSHELVIISGKAGIGKSRLALAALDRFIKENPDYKTYCIFNRDGVSLFNDLKDYFNADGNYLIFIDDANRVSELQHILRLLTDVSDRKKYKIIVTVRDYALDKTKELAHGYDYKEILLQPFDGKKLKSFLAGEFGISNPFYVERIEKISEGNPRIAVMAAEIAKRANRLDSIFNVSEIYDEYFASIAKDLSGLENQNLLKVAGLLSFFRVINFQNRELLQKLEDSFGLSASEIFESAIQLNKMEVADFYEDEIVKISDQILATYLFYKAFFKDNLLSFSTLLNDFFESHRNLLIDSIYPMFDVFDREFLRSKVQPAVGKNWEEIKTEDEVALNFIETFFPFIETESILYLKKKIDSIPIEPFNTTNIQLEPGKNYQLTDRILHILLRFRQLSVKSFGKAVDLMFTYVEKRPSITPQLVHLLIEELCFERDSHLQKYVYEILLIEKLIAKSQIGDRKELFQRIFLRIAGRYLGMEFRSNSSKKMAFIIHRFGLEAGENIYKLRELLWRELFSYFSNTEHQDSILKTLSIYSAAWHENNNKAVAKEDTKQIIPFIESNLDSQNYRDSCIVQDYAYYLEKLQISFPKRLKKRFQTKTYEIAEIVFDKRHKIYREIKSELGFAGYEKYRMELLKTKLGEATAENYIEFLNICVEISQGDNSREIYQLNAVIFPLLIDLADTNKDVFIEVVEYIFKTRNPLNFTNLGLHSIVRKITDSFSAPKEAYSFLRKYDHNLKELWLCCFFVTLEKEETNEYFLGELLELYETANLLMQDFEYLKKYTHLDEKIIIKVIKIVWKRIMDSNFPFSFFHLLYGELLDKFNEIFADDLDLLKQIYFYQQRVESYADYDRKVFQKIYELDPNIIVEYLDFLYQQDAFLPFSDENRDYSFIWESEDFEKQINAAIEFSYEERKKSYRSKNYIKIYFSKSENDSVNQIIKDFLKKFIQRNATDIGKIELIFEIISDNSNLHNEIKDYLAVFLENNKNFEDFRQLSFESTGVATWGSPISTYQGEIAFYESLLPLVESIDFIEHKNAIERQINGLRRQIEITLKEEFVESAYK